MFIIWWLLSVAFGVVASVDASLWGVWFLCCIGCFVLGLVDLMLGGDL